jgi:hypothetical protein
MSRLNVVVALLLVAGLGGCASDNHPVIMIQNRLATPVTVVFLNPAGQENSIVQTVAPGLDYSVEVFRTDKCTEGVLVARDKATGAEVGRSPSPVCSPSRWMIGAATGSASP